MIDLDELGPKRTDHLILVSEKRLRELLEHERLILKYCRPNLDFMWASVVAGIILECDFRDAAWKLKEGLGGEG